MKGYKLIDKINDQALIYQSNHFLVPPLDRDPLDIDPPRIETPLLDRDPPLTETPWTEKPETETPCEQNYRQV